MSVHARLQLGKEIKSENQKAQNSVRGNKKAKRCLYMLVSNLGKRLKVRIRKRKIALEETRKRKIALEETRKLTDTILCFSYYASHKNNCRAK